MHEQPTCCARHDEWKEGTASAWAVSVFSSPKLSAEVTRPLQSKNMESSPSTLPGHGRLAQNLTHTQQINNITKKHMLSITNISTDRNRQNTRTELPNFKSVANSKL
ncbi:hypothetical protein Nepgr_025352 [Nepenthes gracilis]|uniref:Uncharacterized protein n=1 Tax=Nepenthes gracilis TaxID=150966 RepID=A0AAD3T6Q3_NEPGR|nr:hypothetical protein Nepgr_025352 [Nepenthes gracilis]